MLKKLKIICVLHLRYQNPQCYSNKFLRIDLICNRKESLAILSQSKYIELVLTKFWMDDCTNKTNKYYKNKSFYLKCIAHAYFGIDATDRKTRFCKKYVLKFNFFVKSLHLIVPFYIYIENLIMLFILLISVKN